MLFGVVTGLAAAASWAAANVFIQKSSRAVGPFRAVVWSQILGGIALTPFALILDERLGSFDASVVGWAVVTALSAVLAYSCLFFSMERGRLSIVVPVMSGWAVVAAGVSIVFLGDAVRFIHLVGAALVIGGVIMVARFSHADAAKSDPIADKKERGALLAAIGAAVGFGILIPAIDRLAPATGRLGAVPMMFLLDLALGVPLALFARVNLRVPPRAAWPAVAAAALFDTAGFIWISLGVERAPVAVVAPLAGLDAAFTVAIAWLALNERPPRLVLAGAAMACVGVVILSL
jgi:drug/metabolite transporter (DMT)-like permease